MISKSYNYIMHEVEQHFLPAIRKQVQLGNEALDIYIFRNKKTMETESKFISSDGYGYDNGYKGVCVSWVAKPHFFKKGNIIVQYIGGNEKIISDLKAILGEQFAGKK
jgi:hypothetical protein